MASVVFNPEEFREVYPQFSGLSDAALEYAFTEATLFLDPSDKCVVKNEEKRKIMLYLLTCHILTLKNRGVDTVGQVAGASEGSVSVSYAVPSAAGAEYFGQTQCGLSFWQAMKSYTLGGMYFPKYH